MRQVTFAPTFVGWQRAARQVLQEQLPPGQILWQEQDSHQPLLDMGDKVKAAEDSVSRIRVPKSFVDLAEIVACHSSPQRWTLLYSALWRITHGEPHLMQVMVDPGIHRLAQMEKAVRRDVHKMRAFVRFRTVEHQGVIWYVAWFEPEHHVVERNAPFFVGRFAHMSWSILTPCRCAHWDQNNLTFTKGVTPRDAPTGDATESLWLKYYSHIFNPARVKIHAMQAEMPKKYWKNLPEAAVIPTLLRVAPTRVGAMMEKSGAKKSKAHDLSAPITPGASKLDR